MHGPLNVESPNNISKWQMGFNSAFKGLIRPSHRLFYNISLPERTTRFTGRLLSNTHQPIKICQSENVGLSRARVKSLKYASMDPCHFALMATEVSTYMHYFTPCLPQLTNYILGTNLLPFREA
jgi:hypothetical protein